MDYGYLSLAVPLVVVIAAIITREVVFSLFLGVIVWQGVKLGYFAPFETLYLSIESIISLFAKAWVVKSIVFIVLVGSILALIVKSGGVDALVSHLVQKSARIKNKRAALLMGYVIGIVIFIESTITSLVVGAVTAPLAEKFGASRAKVAYICDSTSAPVCSLIPLNGWGALMTGLVGAQVASGVISGDAVGIVVSSVAYNFYSILTLVFVLYIILSGNDFSYMRQSELNAQKHIKNEKIYDEDGAKIVFILLPISLLTISSIVFLFLSGGGDIMKGSGTTAVFYAVITTLLFCFVYFVLWHKRFGADEYFSHIKTGAFDMAYIGVMMLLAFAIGEATKDLGTGAYLAGMVSDATSSSYIAAIVFFASCVISFSTGTSWGTFSVMIPIGIQLGAPLGVDPALMVGAAVAGGVFGDHCSPISDTTIVSAAAAGCDAVEHVKTQLPYAVVVAAISLCCYLFIGFVG